MKNKINGISFVNDYEDKAPEQGVRSAKSNDRGGDASKVKTPREQVITAYDIEN